jgi:uncharacterized protein (DUF58 family)
MKRRSFAFLVSDFFSAPGWARPLAHLARRHETVAVRVTDRLETELPDGGFVVMQDAESGEQILVDTHDSGFRARFALEANRRELGLRSTFALAGVDALELSTSDDLVDSLVRFADMRKERSAMVGGGRGAVAAGRRP